MNKEYYIIKKAPRQLLEMGIYLNDFIELKYVMGNILIKNLKKNILIGINKNILKEMELEKIHHIEKNDYIKK